jgi:replicative DNA helicase
MTAADDFQAAKAAAEARKKHNARAQTQDSDQESGVYYSEPDPIRTEAAVPFPLGVLPEELREWAIAEARFNQVPPSMSAMFALMAAMTASIHLSVRIREGWEEPVVWQAILIASPSERKSPVFAAAFKPVYQWGKDEKKRHKDQQALLERELAQCQVDSEGKPAPVKGGTPESKRVADLKEKIAKLKPPARRICEDITPEEFMRQMSENDGQMCLVSDEADVFQNFGGRYSSGDPKLSPLLKGWDAKSPLMYDRVGTGAGKQRTNIMIDSPRAGIAVAGQYAVLAMLKDNPAYRDKGLLARLCYVVLEERVVARELCPEGVPFSIKEAYSAAIRRMFDQDSEGYLLLANRVEYPNGWKLPKWLQDVRMRVELGVLKGGEFETIPDWAGKLVSNLSRVCAVLECMGGGGEDDLARLAVFFIAHAKRALVQPGSAAPARGTAMDDLAYVVDQLQKKYQVAMHVVGKVQASRTFTARDGFRCCSRLRDGGMVKFQPLLDQLLEMGHLNEVHNEQAAGLGNRASARRFVLIVGAGGSAAQAAPEPIPDAMPKGKAVATEYDSWFDDQADPEDDGREP